MTFDKEKKSDSSQERAQPFTLFPVDALPQEIVDCLKKLRELSLQKPSDGTSERTD